MGQIPGEFFIIISLTLTKISKFGSSRLRSRFRVDIHLLEIGEKFYLSISKPIFKLNPTLKIKFNFILKLSFSPHDGSERVLVQLQSNGPMVDAKSTTGNEEISSKDFLLELANLERKIAANLLDTAPKDIPIESQCDEADFNINLVKAWNEVNTFKIIHYILRYHKIAKTANKSTHKSGKT